MILTLFSRLRAGKLCEAAQQSVERQSQRVEPWFDTLLLF